MPRSQLAERFLAAQAVAREAGRLMRRRFENRHTLSFSFKGHQDYITEVDGEVEKLVIDRLGQAFPGDGFIGEEGGGQPATRVWVIDPIDGTANFARGIPHFCISIAFVQQGVVEIGVIFDPMMDELFAARRGFGATLNGLRIGVSGTRDIQAATIEIGWNMRSGIPGFVALVERVTATGAGMIRSGSGALGVAYVAAGRLDGYVEQHIHAWDVLAGLLLVRESAGYTNNFLRGEGLTKGNPVLVATPELKDLLIAVSGISD